MGTSVCRTLVTGGAGFIGSNLVDALLEQGHEVRVFDNFSTGERRNLMHVAGDIEIVEGDLRSFERALTAVRGCELVLHQGALPSVPRSVQDPLTSNETNATGTLNVLLAARETEVRRVVYASSSSCYGLTPGEVKREDMLITPVSPYGVSKYAGEAYCRSFSEVYGLETVALRYFNVFGPRQNPVSEYAAVVPNFIAAALLGEPVTIYGDGEQARDFTYIDNVVAANLAAASVDGIGGETFNIAYGRRSTINELVALVGEIAATEMDVRHAPARPGDVRVSQADVTKARERLDYVPNVDLREGLRRTYEHMRADPSLLPAIHERRRWIAQAT
jgi:nucleoside-diphosphate-sugar epimerase